MAAIIDVWGAGNVPQQSEDTNPLACLFFFPSFNHMSLALDSPIPKACYITPQIIKMNDR